MLPCCLVLAGLLSAAPNYAVSVAPAKTSADCPAELRLRRLLQLTPGVQLLEDASAPIRVSAEAASPGKVRLRAKSGARQAQAEVRSAQGWGPTLTAIWPTAQPPPIPTAADLPNQAAIERACEGHRVAYELAGAALSRGLDARLKRQRGERELSRALADLDRGLLPPVWRQPRVEAADGLSLEGDTLILFSGPTVSGLSVHTGRARWRQRHLNGEPQLTPIGGGLRLQLLSNAAVASDAEGRVRWRHPLRSPRPEIAAAAGRVYLADQQGVHALSIADGAVIWTHETLSTPSAGPVLTGGALLLPVNARLTRLKPDTGALIDQIALPDEVSDALIASPSGRVWALVGSDAIYQLDPASRKARLRGRFTGLDWPAARLSEALLLSTHRGRRQRALRLLASGRARSILGDPPLQLLKTGWLSTQRGGRQIEVYDKDGRRRARYRARRPLSAIGAEGGRVFFADDRVAVLMSEDGQTLARYPLPGPVEALRFSDSGGVALLQGGELYGLPLPGDPRIDAWRDALELSLGRAALRRGRRGEALRRAAQLLKGGRQDMPAHRLAAEAGGGQQHWRALLESPSPAERAEAQRALDAAIGVTLRRSLGRASALLGARLCESGLLMWRADRLIFQPFAPGGSPKDPRLSADSWESSWRGPEPPRCAGALLWADGAWLAPADGAPVPRLAGARPLAWGAVRESSTGLSRLDEAGLPMWETDGARPGQVLAGDAALLLLNAGDKLIALRSSDGGQRWSLPLDTPVRAAQLGPQVILQTQAELRLLNPNSGRQRAQIPLAPGSAAFSRRGNSLWLAQGETVQLYRADNGALNITLPAALTAGAKILMPSAERADALLWSAGQPPRRLPSRDPLSPEALPLPPVAWVQADGPRWIVWTTAGELLVVRAD